MLAYTYIPHTLEQIFTTAAMIVNNNLASGYGELTVAAMGIANKIMSFGNYIYQSIGTSPHEHNLNTTNRRSAITSEKICREKALPKKPPAQSEIGHSATPHR